MPGTDLTQGGGGADRIHTRDCILIHRKGYDQFGQQSRGRRSDAAPCGQHLLIEIRFDFWYNEFAYLDNHMRRSK